jgi:hypothetical protein
MISFLSKLGNLIVKGAAVIGGFAPLLEAAAPKESGLIQTVSADLSAMANVVVSIEGAVQSANAQGAALTGAQKLQMAIALIQPIVLQSNVIAGKKIADPSLLTKAVGEYAQATVDLLQSVHPDEAQNMVIETMKT